MEGLPVSNLIVPKLMVKQLIINKVNVLLIFNVVLSNLLKGKN